jgi:hypothetical protein
MTNTLIAYHGDSAIKAEYLARVRAHREADELIHGTYWKDGKGCAVGCTVHSGDHSRYEAELGIPIQLARIEDGLFESLPNGQAMLWPEAFLDAIPVGADLRIAYWQFMHWLLVDPTEGVIRFAKADRTKDAIGKVGDLYARLLRGETVDRDTWAAAAAAAAAAVAAASSSAAYWAAAADAAAADAAAADADDDAAAAASAYWAAAADAAAADAAASAYWAAASAAKTRARVRQSEKLLELLRSAPVASQTSVSAGPAN